MRNDCAMLGYGSLSNKRPLIRSLPLGLDGGRIAVTIGADVIVPVVTFGTATGIGACVDADKSSGNPG